MNRYDITSHKYRPISENLVVETRVETRLVCPCCHMGFISLDNEDRFTFPSDNRIIIPIKYPTCNNCGTGFEVEIDRTLKIIMRKIKH